MTITLDTLTLPNELIWKDKFDWSIIKHSVKRSILGRRNISESAFISDSGRPITLSGDPNGWILQSDLNTLYTWANTPDKEMTLTLHDASVYTVRFRHSEQPVVQATPLVGTAFPDNNTYYMVTLLLEVV